MFKLALISNAHYAYNLKNQNLFKQTKVLTDKQPTFLTNDANQYSDKQTKMPTNKTNILKKKVREHTPFSPGRAVMII